MVPSASGAASARLTSRCCSTSERPSNATLATVTWKWSPPPVRSTTSTAPVGERAGEQRADRRRSPSAMMLTTVGRVAFLVSAFPSARVRPIAATVGGALHETFQLALPRVVRRSRLYEATAKNLLRVTIELVGGVAAAGSRRGRVRAESRSPRRSQGRGQRRRARLDRRVRLLAALDPRRRGRRLARLAHVPRRVRRRARARGRPARGVAARLGRRAARSARGRLGDERAARRHPAARARRAPRLARGDPPRRGVAAVAGRARAASSTACARRRGASGRACSRCRSASASRSSTRPGTSAASTCSTPTRRTCARCSDEGFGAYARRVSRPYAEAVARHFDADRPTLTERGLDRLRRDDGAGAG